MNYAMHAYQKTAQTGTSPRQLESTLLMKAATRLKAVQDNWEVDRADLDPAVIYNRKLWTILATAATETDSPLPDDLKRNIATIAIFIFNRSLDLIVDPKASDLDALIEINRNIAIGLAVEPQAAA
jgi:flagellar protein FlaF